MSMLASGNTISFLMFIENAQPIIFWVVLCGAYFHRFKEHKEAGLINFEK